jgi:hypothetical protein
MKKLLTILLVLCVFTGSAQVLQEPTIYGTLYRNVGGKEAILVPSVNGVPVFPTSLKQYHQGAIAIDTLNKKFYFYNPADSSWNALDSYTKAQIDSIISDLPDYSNKVDSVKNRNDSIFYVTKGIYHYSGYKRTDISGKVNYTDSLTKYVTPTQLKDSIKTDYVKPIGYWDNDTLKFYTITDSTLADNSDTTVPTTRAVKAYVDNHAGVGGGGSPNSNIGSGFRLAVPLTNNIKTIYAVAPILLDSVTNTNALTFKFDTSVIHTSAYNNGQYGSLSQQNTNTSNIASNTTAIAGKQNSLTLTTTGTSGAATLTGSTLNIPQYTGGGITADSTITATAGQTSFTFSSVPALTNDYIIFINGNATTNFTASGNTITLGMTDLLAGDKVRYKRIK